LIDQSDSDPIFFNAQTNLIPATRKTRLEEMDQHLLLRNAALLLRKEIYAIEKGQFPNNITLDDLLKGECEIPTSLLTFLKSSDLTI